jgi:ABC-2 type transport system ATP-binding protein
MTGIRIERLRKCFGQVVALDGLSFTVEPSTVFGFLGPNGAGKTTTLRILAGLARADAGQAWIGGQPVGPDSPSRRRTGYLPEEPRFYPWMTAAELLGVYVPGLFGIEPAEGRKRADELLERVGLAEAARRHLAGFSRGMRQRLGLAQALMNRPQVVLLDEPVSGLDPAGRRDMLLSIEGLKAETTVLMSTHILDDVERICDTIGIVDHGRMVALDSRQALLDRFALPLVEIEVQGPAERVTEWSRWAAEVRGVGGVVTEGDLRQFRLDGTPGVDQRILRQALDSGLTVRRFALAKPKLEDVFLRLVGIGDSRSSPSAREAVGGADSTAGGLPH